MSPFRADEISAALSQMCVVCLAAAGDECVNPDNGLPLLEDSGRPVHARRLEP